MPRSFVSGHMVQGKKYGLDKNPKSETICRKRLPKTRNILP